MPSGRATARLLRIANLPTAAADVTAGFLLAGGVAAQWPSLMLIIGASVCLYAGGVALNDVRDATEDARLRPDRPIPSGAISRRAALLLSIFLLAAGCGGGLAASSSTGPVVVALVTAIVAYDVVLKRTWLAPAVMGACRSLNLLLGVRAAGEWSDGAVFAAGVIWLYTASLTYFARHEAEQSDPFRLRIAGAGLVLSVLALVGMRSVVRPAHDGYLFLVGGLLAVVVLFGRPALRSCASVDVRRAVTAFVLSIVLLDACVVFCARGAWAGAATALFVVPCLAAARWVKVT